MIGIKESVAFVLTFNNILRLSALVVNGGVQYKGVG